MLVMLCTDIINRFGQLRRHSRTSLAVYRRVIAVRILSLITAAIVLAMSKSRVFRLVVHAVAPVVFFLADMIKRNMKHTTKSRMIDLQ